MTYIKDIDDLARRIHDGWNTPNDTFPFSPPGQTPFDKGPDDLDKSKFDQELSDFASKMFEKWEHNTNVYHILDNKEQAIYEVDVPGVNKEDINIDRFFDKERDVTTLSVQWTNPRTDIEEVAEINLGYTVDSISARLDKGVLTIEIEKRIREEYESKKVPIE